MTVFFPLLGSTSVKAVRRTLMKLSPGFHNLNAVEKAKWQLKNESERGSFVFINWVYHQMKAHN